MKRVGMMLMLVVLESVAGTAPDVSYLFSSGDDTGLTFINSSLGDTGLQFSDPTGYTETSDMYIQALSYSMTFVFNIQRIGPSYNADGSENDQQTLFSFSGVHEETEYDSHFKLQLASNNSMRIDIETDSEIEASQQFNAGGTEFSEEGVNYCVAFVLDDTSGVLFYSNPGYGGSANATIALASGLRLTCINTMASDDAVFGLDTSAVPHKDHFNGTIRSFEFYQKTLTNDEIVDLCAAGAITDAPTVSPSSPPTTASPSTSPTSSSPTTSTPSTSPTTSPTLSPSTSPSTSPTNLPTETPSTSPTLSPTLTPSTSPTITPTPTPTTSPTLAPTPTPSSSPTSSPSTPPNVLLGNTNESESVTPVIGAAFGAVALLGVCSGLGYAGYRRRRGQEDKETDARVDVVVTTD